MGRRKKRKLKVRFIMSVIMVMAGIVFTFSGSAPRSAVTEIQKIAPENSRLLTIIRKIITTEQEKKIIPVNSVPKQETEKKQEISPVPAVKETFNPVRYDDDKIIIRVKPAYRYQATGEVFAAPAREYGTSLLFRPETTKISRAESGFGEKLDRGVDQIFELLENLKEKLNKTSGLDQICFKKDETGCRGLMIEKKFSDFSLEMKTSSKNKQISLKKGEMNLDYLNRYGDDQVRLGFNRTF